MSFSRGLRPFLGRASTLSSRLHNRRYRYWTFLPLFALISCTSVGGGPDLGRPKPGAALSDQLLLVLNQPPIIHAANQAGLRDAGSVAARSTYARLGDRRGGRLVAASELPYLTGSSEGRAFLAAELPRALARGEPAASCPAVGLSTGRPGVAVKALDACLARLEEVGTLEDCGCRVVALGNVLTVPRSETAYATGISARLASDALGLDLLLVAEETDSGILLRDLRGEVGRLAVGPGDAATLTLSEGAVFSGERIPVGFRRGRLGARYYLADPDGRRVTVLIGFDPQELVAGAGAWLAWGG